MRGKSNRPLGLSSAKTFLVCAVGVVLACCAMAGPAEGQTFSSGSDGSDGAFAPAGPPGTVVVFDPSQFHGSLASVNIFNFTTITVPQGVTVRLSGDKINGPVIWLAQGNVDVSGTIDLSGSGGHIATDNPYIRVPSSPGAGGYPGGVGGDSVQAALPGTGPGGGAAGNTSRRAGFGGVYSGNLFLIPLVGGSGGGGASASGSTFAFGGGAGGGALLVASSTQIVVNGTINARGGDGDDNNCCNPSGGGSGGAIRLISNLLAGSGTLNAAGGGACCNNAGIGGSNGVVRLETFTGGFGGSVQGQRATSSPFPLLLPTAGPASARVVSIGGTPITPNPSTFPDITVNTTSPLAVVIQTQNIPASAIINLTILDENGVADTVIQAPPLGNCTGGNVCTTTVQVTFPFGASRGLTKVTWTQ
jgi:hypothetical protein